MYTPLNEVENEDGDFNIMGRVTQVVHRDHYMSDIRLKDGSNTTWFATVSRKKFPRVTEGEVVKIRSAVVDTDTERSHTIKLAPHSNIMTLVPFSLLRKKLKADINMEKVKVDKELLKGKTIHEPVLASTVASRYASRDVSPLDELFNHPDTSEDTFRTRFYVVKATSGDDAVVLPKGKKSKNKVGPHFAQQFLVKDTSTELDPKVYKVYLYTGGSHGKDFYKGVKPTDKNASKTIDGHLKTLNRFNVHLDAVLKRVGGAYFIHDTSLKF
jgi:hypothetical protein